MQEGYSTLYVVATFLLVYIVSIAHHFAVLALFAWCSVHTGVALCCEQYTIYRLQQYIHIHVY